MTVTVTLTQIQWNSVRRAEGNGFYTWDTERKEVPAGSWTITTGAEPMPVTAPLRKGGYFVLEASAHDTNKRYAVTTTSFYALGDGYTAWARFDHNRIELVPERRTYKPGDTARDHDPVAVGTGDGARDHRARRRPVAPPVRVDLDAAVDLDSDHRRGHP